MISIPKELKDFAVWLNPTNLKVFNKLEMIRLAQKVLRSKTDALDSGIQNALSEGLGDNLKGRGIFALRVYFYQLFRGSEFSLDLRPSRFLFDDGKWSFKGNHLAFEFNEDLRKALVRTYEIYYHNEAQGLRDCLEKMGLISSDYSENEKIELEQIFLNHFQSGEKTKQKFRLNDLVQSFSKIFFYIKKKGGKVPSEFALLGMYLTSLYITLDKVDTEIDVYHAFRVAEALGFPKVNN